MLHHQQSRRISLKISVLRVSSGEKFVSELCVVGSFAAVMNGVKYLPETGRDSVERLVPGSEVRLSGKSITMKGNEVETRESNDTYMIGTLDTEGRMVVRVAKRSGKNVVTRIAEGVGGRDETRIRCEWGWDDE